MKITKITLNEYLLFYKSIYKDDINFKDNKTGTINIVCGKNRPFFNNSKQEIIAVENNKKLICACVLIIHKNAPNMLCMAFFEALPNCKIEVDFLIKYAEQFGKNNNCVKMVLSLDGHVNNGVALPIYSQKPSFGESYCQPYYHNYFEDFNKIKFVSYFEDIDIVKEGMKKDLNKLKLTDIKVDIEYADFGYGFKDTMGRYTDMNNAFFTDHRYYYPREYKEDLDLFNDMRPLLKKENLIFAKYNGKDIGFMLWYPDYNELVDIGKGASVLTFIKYKIFKKIPKTIKIVEIGVNPQYIRLGTIFLLFNAAINAIPKQTTKILSSWILDENTKSKAIANRYAKKHYKDYFAYEKQL